MKSILHKVLMAVVCLSFVSVAFAQKYKSAYQVMNGRVLYHGKAIVADARSFEVLGFGYAKDRMNVYLDGVILKYVDPATFSLHPGVNGRHGHGETAHHGHGGFDRDRIPEVRYEITMNDVFFGSHRVEGVNVGSFKDLGDGYAKDNFSVYYMGRKVDAHMMTSSFKNLGSGYAGDTFDTMYAGKKVVGISWSTFMVLGFGYAKDAYGVYFEGEKINGASPSTFVVDHDGYAHDAYKRYCWGRLVK